MIECPSTPNALHPSATASGSTAAAATAGDSYFTPRTTMPPSLQQQQGDHDSEQLQQQQEQQHLQLAAPTPYFTAPRSPLLQHQEFFNAIQNRYNSTSPFADDSKQLQQPYPQQQQQQQQPPSSQQQQQYNHPPPPKLLAMGSLAARRKQSAAAAAASSSSTASSSNSSSKPPIAPGTAVAVTDGRTTNAPSSILPPPVANRLHAFTTEEINQLLDNNNTTQPHSLLLIDIRSFVHYSHLHIHSAINVSIPNTILKRPSFTLDKVSEVIVSDKQRESWRRWPQFAHIILYDQASEALQESHNAITYLCIKFHQANYQGTLGYLKGGMSSFSPMYPSRCVSAPVTNNPRPKGLNLGMATMTGPMTPGFSGLPSSPATAFSLSSLANGTSSDVSSNNLPKTTTTTSPTASSTSSRKRGPGLHLGSLPPSSAPGPFTAPTVGLDNQQFNPFFSNIRQNMELSHGSIKERFPIRLPPSSSCQIDMATGRVTKRQLRQGLTAVPSWLRDMFNSNDGPRKLAELYEIIERTEQRRLQSVMAHHSKATSNLAEHPFSIVAGIEMGALNRYTNIWPFEYTRVKIKTCSPGSTGYINASFIEYIDCDPATIASPSSSMDSTVPNLQSLTEQRKTSPTGRQYRRYISTQGPLPATFGDFWTVVWEQETRVIVMLTKEEEMNRIKCHRYWPSSVGESVTYGPIKLTFVSETVHTPSSPQDSTDDRTLIREFTLEKDQEKRTVHHIQYMGWMDFGVPDNPIGTLELVKLADTIQTKWDDKGGEDSKKKAGPMIVHCSAGCGRAGAFCAIDTVIHRLRSSACLDRLSEAERSGQLDVMYQTVAKFREQRVSMVQTLRQFVFCYEAILWWILGYG